MDTDSVKLGSDTNKLDSAKWLYQFYFWFLGKKMSNAREYYIFKVYTEYWIETTLIPYLLICRRFFPAPTNQFLFILPIKLIITSLKEFDKDYLEGFSVVNLVTIFQDIVYIYFDSFSFKIFVLIPTY